MNPIFISYRRDDGVATAQLLQRDLQKMFGDDAVFLDVNTMKAGDEFPVELHGAVARAKIVVVMIGRNWKGKDAQLNRLGEERDWVRKELEMALDDPTKKIFPVLVNGATRAESYADLPPSLQRLTKFNYIELREKEYKNDILQLIPVIEPFIPLNDPLKDLPIDQDKYKYPVGSPFKGLEYFTENDTKLFFGRGLEIRKLFNKIRNFNLVMFYGQSGSGKSSVLFAGLKPRLEYKGWSVDYIRRETGVNLAEELDQLVLEAKEPEKHLVILDQVEEIYTNPHKSITPDAEIQQLLSSVIAANQKRMPILMSFRKEYLAEIEKWFAGLPFEKVYLEALQTKGVIDAVRGITLSEEAKDVYELSFADNKVATAIAQTVLSDEESHVAPLLQLLLRKMWDRVENNRPRIFTKELLDEVKSLNMVSFLSDQLKAIKQKLPKEVNSGLVLDLLYFFTTPRGTATSRSAEEIMDHYENKDILNVVLELKNKYLLSEPKQKDVTTTRLAHDSLAPIIREEFGKSPLPAQRASALLESKKQDIETGAEVEFSKPDLAIIDAGRGGMRKITPAEDKVIERSRQLLLQHQLELEEKNKQLEAALGEANAKAMAANARQKYQSDPTLALRMAEAACKMTASPTKEARSAFVDLSKMEIATYKMIWPKSKVSSVSCSPDGKTIFMGTTEKTARLWDMKGEMLQEFKGHSDYFISSAFSPDGKTILTGSRDSTARLWDLKGKSLQTFNGHTETIYSVAFSPDGKMILTGSGDKTARLWDLKGIMIQEFKGHDGSINSVAISPDGKNVVTGSTDNSACLWNLKGDKLIELKGHTDEIFSVAFSPDGKMVLTGSLDKTARIWNMKGEVIQEIKGHKGYVMSAVFSPNANTILTGSYDKTACIWDLNGRMLKKFIGHTNAVNSVIFTQNGDSVFTGSLDMTVRKWNLTGGLVKEFAGHIGSISAVSYSLDGNLIATSSRDTTVRLCDLNGKLIQEFKGHSAPITSLAFSPHGDNLLTGSADKTARLWNLQGEMIQEFVGHSEAIYSVAFSPDGDTLLTASKDSTARVWNRKGEMLLELVGHKEAIYSSAFSPVGSSILTGSLDKTARLWGLNGALIQEFTGHSKNIFTVAFSPNGKQILTGSLDKTARLWDLKGKMLQEFKGHSGAIVSLAFAPDGNSIVTASYDKTARLWDLDGEVLQEFSGHKEAISSLAFSPNGKTILTGSVDASVRVWSPYWELIKNHNVYIPSLEIMKELEIPTEMEWGRDWR